MQIKKMLSHLFDIRLERTASHYNPILEVSLSRGRYRLDTKNATYSFEELYKNFYHAFETLQVGKKQINKVLVLGVGLGSIPIMLETKFNQQAEYTLVEIDQKVIDLAKKYMPKPVLAQSNFICADAYDFIQEQKRINEFDLLAFDVFIDDITAEKFRQSVYLESLKSHLAPNGLLLYNTLKSKRTNEFWETFQAVFPSAHMIPTTGNDMLVFER